MTGIRRQRGYVTVTVMVFAFLLAAIAFLISQQSVIETNMAASEAERDELRYVTEAGLAHAQWALDRSSCESYALPGTPFGAHSYSAIITPDSGSPVSIDVTGTLATGATGTRSRGGVRVMGQPITIVLQPDAKAGKDTSLHGGGQAAKNYGAATPVWVDNNVPHRSLFEFDLSAIPAGTRIQSAQLELYADSIDLVTNATVGVHRVTRAWIEGSGGNSGLSPADGANFDTYDGTNAWTTPGGDYDPTPASTVSVTQAAGQWYQWDVAGLVQQWVDGTVPNFGFIVVGDAGNLEKMNLASSDDNTAAQHPKLTITAVCECGAGKSQTVVLQPGAASGKDTYIATTPKNSLNFGGESTLTVIDAGDHRALLEFDLSWLTPGTPIASAALEIHADTVISPGGGTLHRITAPWTEGSCTGQSGCAGATWDLSDGASPWTTPGGNHDMSVAVTASIGLSDSWVSWDITQYVNGWVGGTYPNYGLLMHPTGNVEATLTSSESPNSLLAPRLTLTFTCPCGTTCMVPTVGGGATGKSILLVVGDTVNLTPEQQAKKALMEGWGYSVSLIATSASQAEFDTAAGLVDVVYVPELGTMPMSELGSKADELTKGVITEESRKPLLLGSFSLNPFVDTDLINITDNSHYITETLPIGNVELSTAVQSLWVLKGTLATDLHVLGELNGTEPGLAYLDVNELRNDNSPAPARRVKLPWGAYNFDIGQLTPDGIEIMRRAIEWGASDPTATAPKNILFVVGSVGGAGPTDAELAHQALLESWGHTVTLIDDDASQADFDSAVAINDVVFTTNDITASRLNTKLVGATIGVVTSEVNLSDEFGMASTVGWDSGTVVEINDNAHYITSPFETGLLSVLSSSESLAYVTGTLSADLGKLASSTTGFGVVSLEAGAQMVGGGSAAGRRAQLPWGGNGFDPSMLTTDGLTILRRAIEWGAGEGPQPPPPGYLDRFNSQSCDIAVDYAGSDGALDWSPWQWVEINETDGPCAGLIQIAEDPLISDDGSYRLLVDAQAVRMRRPVDISGFTAPHLHFDYRLVDYPLNDFMKVRVSSDGGLSWTEVGRFEGPQSHTVYQSASFDLSAHIGVDTMIQFEFNGLSTTRKTYIDNVHIKEASGGGGGGSGSCDGNFRDNFDARSFSGSDGTLAWATDWLEIGESDGPTAGDILVMESSSEFELRTRDNDNGGEGVEREADLSGAATATLNYDYRRMNLDTASDYTSVEVSANGAAGPWVELTRHAGSNNDSGYQPASHSITDYISTNTRVRFKTSSSMGNTDTVWIDNVEIVCTP